jgi:glycosyltransferase involved in cell wall biosynthesis
LQEKIENLNIIGYGSLSLQKKEIFTQESMTSYQTAFDDLKCCVIIPTYNNASTLKKVVDDVLYYTSRIIVINDGSTDETKAILDGYPDLKVVHFAKNCGKGFALRTAIKVAHSLGYMHGITIDSDGQHLASDLPSFLEKIKEEPGAIIIGARNMNQENVPGKSSFGNKFSNFWFRFETGIKLPDTQSGYRAYPFHLLYKKHYLSRKFEFEIEVIVKAAWKNIKVMCIPIKVYYAPENERISHFKPIRDFTRISILNTILVLIALLIVKPFRFMHWLNKKNIREFYEKHIVQNQDSDAKITFSIMLGLFMGIAPFWGYQMGLALLLAMFFKLNKVITLVASNISIPPMIPVIIYLSYLFGGFVYSEDVVNVAYSSSLTLRDVKINVLQYVYGSFVFAMAMSVVFGLLTYILLKIFRKKRIADSSVISDISTIEPTNP